MRLYAPPAAAPRWQADLDGAARALADLDCEQARSKAASAILELAAEHALGRKVAPELTRAYVIWLRCGQSADTPHLVQRLRALGHSTAPKGVTETEWQSAATNASSANLEIAGPAGAQIWLDHKDIGTAPVVATASLGRHLIVATKDGRVGAKTLLLGAGGQSLTLSLEVRERTDDPIQIARKRWMTSGKAPQPSEVGTLLGLLDKRVALLLMPGGQVHLWARPGGSRFARRVSGAPATDPAYVARLVRDWVSREDSPQADNTIPLMREDPNKREDATQRSSRWWVYAAVGAAVTVASVIIISDQFASDRQRIELTLP